ncbi:MAG TPA: sulfate permease [Methyloprofundus sp.]|uniref:SulP family inorganic anion transporter n=1 Tax=Methyloprofundus sp. TaxID=2020875 RepID=UPI001859DA6B|nr:sulfate permease [Methyloprofundus sp.]HIG65010.1 sulfate permease [Methyloprofundus sp.]HIL77628.1 sulfate permease [Methylococcales bacterium]
MASPQTSHWINSYFPISSWLKNYTRKDLNGDIFAGIITAILLVPQGIAYAMLAGLPPQMGLYASILPPLIYTLLGTSRTLSVGPVSIAAIMIASVLTAPEITPLGSTVENAIILAAEGGFILLFMAMLRMGGLVNFISHPVLTGFTSGAAILIVLSQIPHLLGLSKNQCGFDLPCYNAYLQQFNHYTVGLSLFSIALLLSFGAPLATLLKRFNVKTNVIVGLSKSAPLLAVIITTLLVTVYQLSGLQNVAIVGEIQPGLPDISFTFFTNMPRWQALLPGATFIAIIAYVESVAIAKVTATLRNQKINPNQELIALGTANLVTAFSGGMSVAGGFSRTMVNFSAGARTQMAMLIAVLILSIAVIFFTEQFTYLPKAALAAVILIAIFPLIKLREIITTWKYDQGDGIAELITLLGVLALGIEEGIALGVIITIISYLRRTSRPHIAVVGRIKETEHFRNINRHEVETWENLLLIRIDENISFANVSYIIDFIEVETLNSAGLKHIVLIFSSVSYIDSTAFEALENLIQALHNKHILLHLAEVKGPVLDKLQQTNFLDQLNPGEVFFQTVDAVDSLSNK